MGKPRSKISGRKKAITNDPVRVSTGEHPFLRQGLKHPKEKSVNG